MKYTTIAMLTIISGIILGIAISLLLLKAGFLNGGFVLLGFGAFLMLIGTIICFVERDNLAESKVIFCGTCFVILGAIIVVIPALF